MRFSIFCKSASGVCFSDSARKMTQNGGRVVAIGWIFDMNIKAYVRNKEKIRTTECLVMADPKSSATHCSWKVIISGDTTRSRNFH